MEKLKPNYNRCIITSNFPQNMHRVMLFAQSHCQDKQEKCVYPFFITLPMTDVFLVFIFFCANHFYSIQKHGYVQSLISGLFFSLCYFLDLHMFSNSYRSCQSTPQPTFREFIKLSSFLRKYFIAIYAFVSVHALEKSTTRMGYQEVTHALSKPIWGLFLPSFRKAL